MTPRRGSPRKHPAPPALVEPHGALPRSFYAREADEVARGLLGAVLVRRVGERLLRARIVETEAYVGEHDLACHAAKGRTGRTEVMFGPPGHAYVYLIYGMYQMLNVVTGADGSAQAVLIRAGEPLEGLEGRMDGPGRLARAFAVARGDNGLDLCEGELYFTPGEPPREIVATPRIGVDYAGEWAAAPLRFIDPESRHVSKAPSPKGRSKRKALPSGVRQSRSLSLHPGGQREHEDTKKERRHKAERMVVPYDNRSTFGVAPRRWLAARNHPSGPRALVPFV